MKIASVSHTTYLPCSQLPRRRHRYDWQTRPHQRRYLCAMSRNARPWPLWQIWIRSERTSPFKPRPVGEDQT